MLKVVEDAVVRAELAAGLDEIVREGARRMLAAALEAEVEAYRAAHAGERDEAGRRLVVRNGHARARQVTTVAGAVEVRVPRVDDRRVDAATGERRRFRSALLPPWCRRSPKVTEVLPLLYLHTRPPSSPASTTLRHIPPLALQQADRLGSTIEIELHESLSLVSSEVIGPSGHRQWRDRQVRADDRLLGGAQPSCLLPPEPIPSVPDPILARVLRSEEDQLLAGGRGQPPVPRPKLGCESIGIAVADVGVPVGMALPHPVLAQPICHVGRLAAEHEMSGPDTPRVVTQVQHRAARPGPGHLGSQV